MFRLELEAEVGRRVDEDLRLFGVDLEEKNPKILGVFGRLFPEFDKSFPKP